MSAVSSYNVGLGLNFSGQGDEQGIDTEMNRYPQEQYYASYAQGMQLKSDLLILAEYNSTAALTSPPNGQFLIPRLSRSEGNPVIPLSFCRF